jgi:hypothetical protein
LPNEGRGRIEAGGTQAPPQAATEKGFVCGMKVDPKKALTEKYIKAEAEKK